MTLDRSSWAVRYYIFLLIFAGNSSFEIEWRIERIKNLCQFVRGIVLRTIGMMVVAAICLGAIVALGLLTYMKPLQVFGFFLGIAGGGILIAAIMSGVGAWCRARKDKPDGVVISYAKAVKRGICPLLTIKNTNAQ